MVNTGKKIIVLKQDFNQNCWAATFDDVETLKLFGTQTIQTPFTLQVGAQEARKRIENLNPGYTVAVVENLSSTPVKTFHFNEKLYR